MRSMVGSLDRGCACSTQYTLTSVTQWCLPGVRIARCCAVLHMLVHCTNHPSSFVKVSMDVQITLHPPTCTSVPVSCCTRLSFSQARRPQRPSPTVVSTGGQRLPLVAFGRRVQSPAARTKAGSPEAGRGVLSPQVGHLSRLCRQSTPAVHAVTGRELVWCHGQTGLRCAAGKPAEPHALPCMLLLSCCQQACAAIAELPQPVLCLQRGFCMACNIASQLCWTNL